MLRDPFSRRNLQGYIFQTGQPPEVREAFLAAMGFTEAELEPEPASFDPLAPGSAQRLTILSALAGSLPRATENSRFWPYSIRTCRIFSGQHRGRPACPARE